MIFGGWVLSIVNVVELKLKLCIVGILVQLKMPYVRTQRRSCTLCTY